MGRTLRRPPFFISAICGADLYGRPYEGKHRLPNDIVNLTSTFAALRKVNKSRVDDRCGTDLYGRPNARNLIASATIPLSTIHRSVF